MKSDRTGASADSGEPRVAKDSGRKETTLTKNIGHSIDTLVDYLVDNEVCGIHQLIMGEVERRLIIKTLERTSGNKLRAAKALGISRNTFHRKIQKLTDPDSTPERKRNA